MLAQSVENRLIVMLAPENHLAGVLKSSAGTRHQNPKSRHVTVVPAYQLYQLDSSL